MNPLETIPYKASGGDSERRNYADGEGILIESQDKGYVLAWSAEIEAPDFLRIVSQLVDTSLKPNFLRMVSRFIGASVKLEYDDTGKQHKKSMSRALRAVTNHPETNVIQVDAADETFRWTMHDPYADERRDLTRVTLAFSALDAQRVTELITDTAAPHIKDDINGIMASVAHLTQTAPPTAA